MQPFPVPGSRYSEDCLTLNIYRPPAAARTGPLPVMLFIHGGSWQSGSGSEALFNGTNLVARSVQLGEPILLVTINYRLGFAGFIAGPEVDAADAAGKAVLNAGYWDQREALKWVQANIASFGGSPAKVTIFGESAGANSVAAQMLADQGRVGNLFRGAIMESGSQATAPRFGASDDAPTLAYQIFLQKTGCQNLACLRKLTSQQLLDGQTAIVDTLGVLAPFTPVRDRYFAQELPSAQFAAGRFPSTPFISGSNLDEGTLFSPVSLTTDDGFDAAAMALLGGPAIQPLLPQLRALYPNDPVVGSPFDAPLFGRNSSDRFYTPKATNQYKRIAAAAGDGLFQVGRRQQLQASAARVNCWSYLFKQPLPSVILLDPSKGVAHASELQFVFAQPPAPFTGAVTNASTAAAAAKAGPADIRRTAELMTGELPLFCCRSCALTDTPSHTTAAWIHFATRLSPAGKDVPAWPVYGSQANTLQIQGVSDTKVIVDDHRKPQMAFFLDHPKEFSI